MGIEHESRCIFGTQEYAATLINSSLDMIIAVDVHREIVEFNRAAEQTFGYRKAEVLGQPVDLLYANPSEGVQVHTNTLGEGGFTGEITNKRKNGEIVYVYLSASVIRDAQGRVVGVMGISRDITERKRAEARLAELVVQLQQSHDDLLLILNQLHLGT